MITIVVPVIVFSAVVVTLAATVLLARSVLSPGGTVTISINGRREIEARPGRKLLNVLADSQILLPSACGGRGTCGQCRVGIQTGAPPLLPTEANHINRREAASGQRLACMLKIRGPLSLTVPNDILSARRLICTVASSRDVATFLKELVLTLPEEEHFEFVAGDYVILEAPPYRLAFQDFVLEPAHREEWQHLNLLSLKSELDARTTRAYSLASEPQRHDQIALVVRIAIPPARSAPDTPPGRVSTYIFGLKPGDTVEIAGPYGDFHVRETDKEIVLIGGGAGIAPLRSIILDQLARGTRRKMSLWYGARDLRDLCYRVELEAAATTHENFEYHVALSQLREGEAWTGPTGFIHAVVYERYLSTHPAPEDCEYYLCGPPLMSAAVIHMLDELGVDADNIFYDDFGS